MCANARKNLCECKTGQTMDSPCQSRFELFDFVPTPIMAEKARTSRDPRRGSSFVQYRTNTDATLVRVLTYSTQRLLAAASKNVPSPIWAQRVVTPLKSRNVLTPI